MKYIYLFFLYSTITFCDYQPAVSKELSIYSDIAYKSEISIVNWNCAQCNKFKLIDISIFGISGKQLFAFIGYSNQLSGIVVSFRGSSKNNVQNILTDLNVLDVAYPKCKDCYVHKGFYAAFLAIKGLLAHHLKETSIKHPKASIYFTGHSLGGALASMAAAEFSKDYKLGAVYTFGKPRVGNKKYADWFNLNITAYRIVHFHDIVPSTPPRSSPVRTFLSKFSHTATVQRHELMVLYHENLLTFEYFHEGKLVWYSADMSKFQICDGEDSKCYNSVQHSKLTGKDHPAKYYTHVLASGKPVASHLMGQSRLSVHDLRLADSISPGSVIQTLISNMLRCILLIHN